ncbi:hypothetical protein V6N11_012116 [Hibiscus sabdariffa]|uniref:Xyloglucan endotransglucosylase/hydrolase n=1 Tax=Hibiscus sabdariffa TaxID=183260 RepID=A0ABR2QAL8_9ROSI
MVGYSSSAIARGSGFRSKLRYGTGFFSLRIKLPDKDSAGVVTAYYVNVSTYLIICLIPGFQLIIYEKTMMAWQLTSEGNKHDELDFEFLGNKQGKPITLQTNVFAGGVGNREQRFLLWFDPTADFHNYQLLWNQHQIVFYVDDIPIRVFKNNKDTGVGYPSQAMKIEASLWDGDSWATDGGRTKTNWTSAPFKAHFQGFDISGCPKSDHDSSTNQECFSPKNWWNTEKYWTLDSKQKGQLENVRNKYMNYDYCSDRHRYPVPPPECLHQ